jgi:hypothetical protein
MHFEQKTYPIWFLPISFDPPGNEDKWECYRSSPPFLLGKYAQRNGFRIYIITCDSV